MSLSWICHLLMLSGGSGALFLLWKFYRRMFFPPALRIRWDTYRSLPLNSKGWYPDVDMDKQDDNKESHAVVRRYHERGTLSISGKSEIERYVQATEHLYLQENLDNLLFATKPSKKTTFTIIWLRSGFCSVNDVSTFAWLIRNGRLSNMLPFVLVTTDGDNAMPSILSDENRDALLANPKMLAWLTQNYDGKHQHPKLHPVPIGFDVHTPLNVRSGGGVAQKTEKKTSSTDDLHMMMLTTQLGGGSADHNRRRRAIVVDKCALSHSERKLALAQLSETANAHNQILMSAHRQSLEEVWRSYRDNEFGVSIRGRGLDCHRTWEMLYFGMIPIIKHSSLDPMFDGLPVVFVEEWTEVLNMDLAKAHCRAMARVTDASLLEKVFDEGYWIHRCTTKSKQTRWRRRHDGIKRNSPNGRSRWAD